MTQEDINDLLARNPSPEAQIQYEEMRTLKQAKGAHINHATCHECPCKLNFDAMKAELEQEETDHQETAKYLEDTRQKHLKAEADRAELLGLLQWADEHLLPHKWLDISEPGCRIPEMREALAKHGG